MQDLFQSRLIRLAVIAGLFVLSLAAWLVSSNNGWVLAYNDSMSHLNMARLALDNQNPGIAQIGSVWLPLSHILTLPLVWIDAAWQNGFAGSFVSMVAFVGTVIGIAGITYQLTENKLAAAIAGIAAAANVNLLYLQTTPLTEPLYVGLFVGAVYHLIKYIRTDQVKYLLPLALLSSLQILTRYDGWFVGAVLAAVLLAYELIVRQRSFSKAVGNVMLFAVPVAFAGLLWIGWNAVIYGDPLYFATGPFSAQAQQQVIENQSGLMTKGDLGLSMQAVGLSAMDNIGWVIGFIALLGWLFALWTVSKHFSMLVTAFVVLTSVIVFNVLSLYLGFSILNMPELNWNPTGDSAGSMFNVRYGILALPFAAIGVGLFAAEYGKILRTPAMLLLIAAVAIQAAITAVDKPITLQDGQIGSSAFVQHGLAEFLEKNVGQDEEVLMSMSYFNPVAHASTLQLDQFIHEGAGTAWRAATNSPKQHVEWIVMSNGSRIDPVYKILQSERRAAFTADYQLMYQDKYSHVYQVSNRSALR